MFVRDALRNPLGAEVVASMIRVARAAGSQVVAEQVEDQATIELMTSLGAHFVQGYAISKPRPLEEMILALGTSIVNNEEGLACELAEKPFPPRNPILKVVVSNVAAPKALVSKGPDLGALAIGSSELNSPD
jgi:hypothetical protein